MAIELYQDFKELFISLNSSGVRYIVVGGYAVIYHGYSRTTGGLDIWVEQSADNFKLLQKAFIDFGFPLEAISETDFLQNEKDVYTFGRPPVCIELLTAVKGLSFSDSFKNITAVTIDGVEVNMIDLRDLITAKKAAGRHKDLDDIENIS